MTRIEEERIDEMRKVADALDEFAMIDEAEGGNPLVIATERRAAELLRAQGGVRVLVNDAMIERFMEGWNDSHPEMSHDMRPSVKAGLLSALSALEAEAVEPEGQGKEAAVEIADAVLAWMVKYDLIDADLEYRDDDIIEVLDDLRPTPLSPVPTVTGEMVERLAQELWSRLDLNGHTGDGVRLAARAGLIAALSSESKP